MTPFDIVKILTAAAPIAASVASIANTKSEPIEKIERKEQPNITNNISVTVNNNFYTNSEKDAKILAQQMQNELIGTISSGTRYML